jgi:hypothetical protein
MRNIEEIFAILEKYFSALGVRLASYCDCCIETVVWKYKVKKPYKYNVAVLNNTSNMRHSGPISETKPR